MTAAGQRRYLGAQVFVGIRRMRFRDFWQSQTPPMKPCRSFLWNGPKPSAEKNSINRSAKCSQEKSQEFHSATQVKKRHQAQFLVQQLGYMEFFRWLAQQGRSLELVPVQGDAFHWLY